MDIDKELEVRLNSVKRTFELIPLDYIPCVGTNIGNVLIENAFGLKAKFPQNPEQTPYWDKPLITDIDDIYKIKVPDPFEDKFFQKCLDRLRYIALKADSKMYIGSYDIGGPINIALNLMDSSLFYVSLIENPEAIHNLLEKTTQACIIYYSLLIDAAGGINNMGTIYFSSPWSPEGYKALIADDVCANIPPKLFNEFSKPYNSRIYGIYGPGLLHNCGPNPCVSEYLNHHPPIKACQVPYEYSRNDIEEFAKYFAYKGILYVSMGEAGLVCEPDQIINDYREVCEKLSPKTIAILQCTLDDNQFSDNEILDIYNELKKISIEYTKSIKWP